MNQINPGKLLLSKWTAVKPRNRERHFIVNRLLRDEQERITGVVIEAVINRNAYTLEWQELKDSSRWRMGWQ